MKVTISKAITLKLSNEYQKRDLDANYEIYKEINKFHHCYSEVEVSERDGEYWVENTRFLLKNDAIDVVIRYDSYRKRYSFYGNWNTSDLKNLSHYQISDIKKEFKEPRGVGKLAKKKIADWIKYEEEVYLACKEKNDERDDKVSNFLKTLEGQDVQWYNCDESRGQYNGEVIKNGIKYSFKISDGYINQSIEVHYKVPSNLESFLLLSDNKVNRENKIERILKN